MSQSAGLPQICEMEPAARLTSIALVSIVFPGPMEGLAALSHIFRIMERMFF